MGNARGRIVLHSDNSRQYNWFEGNIRREIPRVRIAQGLQATIIEIDLRNFIILECLRKS